MSVDRNASMARIQKFCGSTLRAKQYEVKFNEIYLASANYASSHNQLEGGDDVCDDVDGMELYDEGDSSSASDSSIPVRRSTRLRHEPERLATSEIQSCTK